MDVREVQLPEGMDARAAKEFGRIRDELAGLGYCQVDAPALIGYLTHFSYFMQAKEVLDREGLFITTPLGSVQIHPAHSVMKQNSEMVKKYIQELGFSPGSRSRLGKEVGEKQEDLFGDGEGDTLGRVLPIS